MNYYTINYYDNRKILFGPVAGIVESICMQPLDTMKVLKQSNQYTNFSSLIKKPKYLYKGLTPFTGQMFVKYFLRFTAFEIFKSKNNNTLQNFAAGICAGFTESLFITPFELIKTNLQTTQNKKPFLVINNIYNEKGIRGLYRGFSTTAIRQCTNQAFNFSIYYKLRTLFIKEDERPNILKIIGASLFSSSIGPILTSPIDTLKTRFMNPNYNYTSIFGAIRDIIKNEGIKTFYKGIGFRLIRVCGGQAITFCVVENLLYYTN
jgi:hypothetical protein